MSEKTYRVVYLVSQETSIDPEHYEHIPNPENPFKCIKSDIEGYKEGACTLEELIEHPEKCAEIAVLSIKELEPEGTYEYRLPHHEIREFVDGK